MEDLLTFTMDVAATDTERRTVEGTIVPYGEAATINGARYRFLPGSLTEARARTPLLLDHDRGRPIGVLAQLVDEPGRAFGRFRIDRTPAGDEALAQAASGSRGSFSLGASVDPDDATDAGDGVLDVRAARLHEVSLLTLGAFENAAVTRVVASAPAPAAEPEPEPDPDAPDEDEDEENEPEPGAAEPDPDEEDTMHEVKAAAPVMLATARKPRELTAGEYVQTMLQAQRGDRVSTELLAALTETGIADIPGLLPPGYETRVIGPAPVDRTLYRIFGGRPLPSVGLVIQKPVWTTLPDGEWAASVDADATTGKAVVGLNAANVERWDWATAIPYIAVKRSSPDAIDSLYAAAVEDFHLDVEVKIAALLALTAPAPVAAVTLGAGIGAFYTATGRAPEVVVVAPDVWGLLADSGALIPSVGFAGSSVGANDTGLHSMYAGLPIVASGALAAGAKYLATRRSLDVRVTEPVQLTANAIGALNVELGVVGEGLFDADYPAEVMALAAGAPITSMFPPQQRSGK